MHGNGTKKAMNQNQSNRKSAISSVVTLLKTHRIPILFGIIFCTVVVLRVQTFTSLGNKDVGVFAYIGERILHGEMPYRDMWDHKSPLLYYVFALLFGVFGTNLTIIAVTETIWITVTAFFIYKVARKHVSEIPAICSAIIFTIYVGVTYIAEGFGMTETYALLPSVLAVYFYLEFLHKRNTVALFVSGMMVSVAFLFRQTAGVLGPVLLLFVLQHFFKNTKSQRLSVQSFVLGILAPVSLVFAFFYVHGSLEEFISQVFTYNFIYSEGTDVSFITSISTLVAEVEKVFNKWPLLLILAVTGVIISVINLYTFVTRQAKESVHFEILLVMWFVVDLFAIMFSGRYYTHYSVQLIASAALLAGVAIEQVMSFQKNRLYKLIFLAILVIGATPFYPALSENISYTRNRTSKDFVQTSKGTFDTEQKDRIEWILKNSDESDSIYFWGGEVGLNFVTGRQVPTQYLYIYPLLMKEYVSDEMIGILISDLQRNNPKYIIDATQDHITLGTIPLKKFDEYQGPITKAIDYIYSTYEYFESVGGWEVYRLRQS